MDARACLAALLILAACGGDDAETGDRGSSSSTSTTADAGDLGEAIGEASDDITTTTDPDVDWEPVLLPVTVGSVPDTAGDSNDACNVPTSYDAAALVDRQPDTAWRMSGDATGQTLTFSIGGERRVRQVGVVPGYAKIDPCDGADRFVQNRRVTTVTWLFDDGTQTTQPLEDRAEMQTIEVDATTTSISLRIDGVTPDPQRDFTALSEVSVRGR